MYFNIQILYSAAYSKELGGVTSSPSLFPFGNYNSEFLHVKQKLKKKTVYIWICLNSVLQVKGDLSLENVWDIHFFLTSVGLEKIYIKICRILVANSVLRATCCNIN